MKLEMKEQSVFWIEAKQQEQERCVFELKGWQAVFHQIKTLHLVQGGSPPL